jgi:hypothetical protein
MEQRFDTGTFVNKGQFVRRSCAHGIPIGLICHSGQGASEPLCFDNAYFLCVHIQHVVTGARRSRDFTDGDAQGGRQICCPFVLHQPSALGELAIYLFPSEFFRGWHGDGTKRAIGGKDHQNKGWTG